MSEQNPSSLESPLVFNVSNEYFRDNTVSSKQQPSSSPHSRPKSVQGPLEGEKGELKLSEEKQREVLRTHSLNDFSNDDSEDSISKKEKHRLSRIGYRNRIANEILETERNYIKNLHILIGLYVLPLRTTVDTPDEIVNDEDLKNIFSNVELLVKINSELLQQLQQRMDNWSDTQLIGDVFDKMAPHFKLYTDYGKNYLTALNTVDTLSQTNQKFADFLQFSQKFEDNNNLTMHAFLIAPIQRLPRIILLLQDLKAHTEPDHPDYANLENALQKFQHVTDHVNEGIKYAENTRKIVELQNRFSGNMNFLHPTRKFVREGRLQKITSRLERSCWFFLFNDQLVYAYEIMGYYHYKGSIPLQTSWINDMPDTSDKQNLFQVVGEKKTYTLYAPTAQVKLDWINDLNAQINKLVELNPQLIEKRSAVKVRSRGGLWKPLGELLGQSLPYMALKEAVTSPPSSTSLPVIQEVSPLVQNSGSSRTSLKLIPEANQAPLPSPAPPPDSWTCCSNCNIL